VFSQRPLFAVGTQPAETLLIQTIASSLVCYRLTAFGYTNDGTVGYLWAPEVWIKIGIFQFVKKADLHKHYPHATKLTAAQDPEPPNESMQEYSVTARRPEVR